AIATNTTVSRAGIEHMQLAKETGGLSGAPLLAMSTTVLHWLSTELKGKVPIIGVGGVMNGQDAKTKIEAGATLVQIYSGLIYHGPQLIREAAIRCQRQN